MRSVFMFVALTCLSASSSAADQLILVGPRQNIPADEPRWVVCMRWDRSNDYKYVSQIRRSTYGEASEQLTWGDFVKKNYKVSDNLYGGCNVEESEKDATWRYNLFREHDPNFPKTLVEVEWTGPISTPRSTAADVKKASPDPQKQTDAATTKSVPTAGELAAEKRKAADERFREAQARYEADLSAQKRQVEDFERAAEQVARKKAEQEAAAQKAINAFKAEQAAHAEVLKKHQEQVSNYQRELLAQQQGTKAQTARRVQATGSILDTRDAAMASLLRLRLPSPLSDVQCGEVKMFSPAKWTCWGFYQDNRQPSSGSKQ